MASHPSETGPINVDPDDPDLGKAKLVYELCCGLCGEYEYSIRPLKTYAAAVGFFRDWQYGWVHVDCLEGEARDS